MRRDSWVAYVHFKRTHAGWNNEWTITADFVPLVNKLAVFVKWPKQALSHECDRVEHRNANVNASPHSFNRGD
jgi:hypothetical protein